MERRGALAAAAVGAAALIGIPGPAAWASSGHGQSGSAGSGSASSAPAGNNGHIQIDEFAMDGGNGNDPHVACGFSISFFGYDTGSRTATVSVTPWAPTAGGTPFHSGSLTWDVSHRTSGNQMDFNYPVPASTVAGMFSGVAPAKQGYHARIEVEVNGSQGSDDKHKMVWIAPCTSGKTGVAGPAATAGSSETGASGVAPTAASSGAPASAAPGSTGTSASGASPSVVNASGRVSAAGASRPVEVLGESVSRPLAAAPAGASARTLGGLPFTGADIAGESAVALGLIGAGGFLTRRYRLRRG